MEQGAGEDEGPGSLHWGHATGTTSSLPSKVPALMGVLPWPGCAWGMQKGQKGPPLVPSRPRQQSALWLSGIAHKKALGLSLVSQTLQKQGV